MKTISNKIRKFVLTIIMLCSINHYHSQTVLYSEDFESQSGYITSTTSSNQLWINTWSGHGGCSSNDLWYVGSSGGYGTNPNISGRYANINYGSSSCYQNVSLRTKIFTATKSSIDISFNWAHRIYFGSSLMVRLYTSSGTLVSTLVSTSSTSSGDVNESVVVVPGNSYYLDFRYIGNWEYGSKIDNILITEEIDGQTTVGIGNGTNDSGVIPSYGYYRYSWSSMIFLQSEINETGEISNLSFYVDNGSPASYTMPNQKIYIGHTTNSSFGSSVKEDIQSNYGVTNWTLVYDGTINWVRGWSDINLTNRFSYNNSDNLIVKVENRAGFYGFSYPEFDYTSSTNRSGYNYNDGAYPTANGSRTSNRPNIRMTLLTASPLSIDLTTFDGYLVNGRNVKLEWSVASQTDNDYFTVYKSEDGYNWNPIGKILGGGTTNVSMDYSYDDTYSSEKNIIYYKLSQTDYNGVTKLFNVISVEKQKSDSYVVKEVNLLGQDVDKNVVGVVIQIWSDGKISKIIK